MNSTLNPSWLLYIVQLQYPCRGRTIFQTLCPFRFQGLSFQQGQSWSWQVLTDGVTWPAGTRVESISRIIRCNLLLCESCYTESKEFLENSLNTQKDGRALHQVHWANCQLLRQKAVNNIWYTVSFFQHFLGVLLMSRSLWQVSCRRDTVIKDKK